MVYKGQNKNIKARGRYQMRQVINWLCLIFIYIQLKDIKTRCNLSTGNGYINITHVVKCVYL